MVIKFYKYYYTINGDTAQQSFEYFYTGSGFYLEDLESDVIGLKNNALLDVSILSYEEISQNAYEAGTGKPFELP